MRATEHKQCTVCSELSVLLHTFRSDRKILHRVLKAFVTMLRL